MAFPVHRKAYGMKGWTYCTINKDRFQDILMQGGERASLYGGGHGGSSALSALPPFWARTGKRSHSDCGCFTETQQKTNTELAALWKKGGFPLTSVSSHPQRYFMILQCYTNAPVFTSSHTQPYYRALLIYVTNKSYFLQSMR